MDSILLSILAPNYYFYSLTFVFFKNQFSGAFVISIFYRLLAYTCLMYYLFVSSYFVVFLAMQQQKQNFSIYLLLFL